MQITKITNQMSKLKFPPTNNDALKSFWLKDKSEEDKLKFEETTNKIIEMITTNADDGSNVIINKDIITSMSVWYI